MIRRWAWPFLVVLFVAVLAYGSLDTDAAPLTGDARVQHLAGQIRCPTCRGLSVAESDSALAQSARTEIEQQVAAGRSDGDIRDYFVTRYGDTALMSPDRKGIDAAVWLVPIVLGAVAVTGVLAAVERWRRRQPSAGPSAADRALVDDALAGRS